MQACHASALGGHSGAPITYMRMKKIFAWTRIKTSVHSFVKSCLVCQQAKHDRSKLPGLLQPLEVPSQAWQIISLDFVEGLPCQLHSGGSGLLHQVWSLSPSSPSFYCCLVLPSCLCNIFIDCMGYLWLWYLTEIGFSLVIFGRCCSLWLMFN